MPLVNLQKKQFQNIMQEHISDIIAFLFDENQEFGVACDISYLKFEPPLPKEIEKKLPPISLFILANYTFESAIIDDNSLQFEAGFGTQNFASFVYVPLLAIKQIFVEEYPILINIVYPPKEEKEEQGVIDSMNVLLKNPENAKLLKKKKKPKDSSSHILN